MSAEYKDQDPLVLAQQAERDLNSHAAKHGLSSDLSGTYSIPYCYAISRLTVLNPTAEESGVDQSVTNKFPGSTVKVGSAASGAGGNREIPADEGGDILDSGR